MRQLSEDRVRREQLFERSNRCAEQVGRPLGGSFEFGLGGDPIGDEPGCSRLPDPIYPEEVRFRHTR